MNRRIDKRPGIALALLLPGLLLAQPKATAPKILASFDAVAGDAAMSYKDHPDMAMAACSNCGKAGQVLVATGKDVAVYDLAGKLLKTQTATQFIRAAGLEPGKINDPRAAYDPFIGRWIVACSCSIDFLMVSGSKDATGPWKGVALTGASGDLTMFPGWDKNGVYISEFQRPLNSLVIALPSADVAWKGDGNISLAHKAVFADRLYEMRPAIDPNPNKKPADPEYLISRSGPPQNATNHAMNLLVDRINWTGNQAAVSGPTTIPTGLLYNTPIATPQPSGQNIRGNESHRVFSVWAHDGHLHVVEASGPCASDCGSQGVDANNLFYWFDIAAPDLTLSHKAKIADPSLSFLFPTLAVDGRGNVAIGVSGSSTSQKPSVYLYTHLANDPAPDKINGPFLAFAGTESYACDKSPRPETHVVGWGTYSATLQDGSDPTKLWTIQEYGVSATSCLWNTRVVGFRIEGKKVTNK